MTYSIRIHLRDIIEMLKYALVDMCDVTNNTYEVKAHTYVYMNMLIIFQQQYVCVVWCGHSDPHMF